MPFTPSQDDSVFRNLIKGKRVCLVGGGPSALNNRAGYIDSFDTVVRVNQFKLTGNNTGRRVDVHFSFFGNSVKTNRLELINAGCKVCVIKSPPWKVIHSEWKANKSSRSAINPEYIYRAREKWWPCPAVIISEDELLSDFFMLGGHVPTTGFSAMMAILRRYPAILYMTGFDFFESGKHNLNERWEGIDSRNPIRHRPDLEYEFIKGNRDGIIFDTSLSRALRNGRKAI